MFTSRSLVCSLSLVLVAFSTPPAEAALIYDATVAPTKSNGHFIAGSGISADGFAIDTATTGESVALKARPRNGSGGEAVDDDVYYVQRGTVIANDTLASAPWWAFDYQFSPGDDGGYDDGYRLKLEVDFDPDYGATDFATFDAPIKGPDNTINPFAPDGWDDGDGFFTNPGGGAWSSDDVDFVVSQSWNYGYDFWSTSFGKTYDPDAPGEYEIVLTAFDAGDAQLAQSHIFVRAVPEPASLVLVGLGLAVGGVLLRRKRL